MYPTSSEDLNKETDEAVYFFTPPFDPLNNFSAHVVEIWDIKFPTVEHAYHWKKFSETKPAIAAKILAAKSPQAAKDIADANVADLPAAWHDEKVLIMEQINQAKVDQHDDVRDALRRTGKRAIIENSPTDSFWGIGPDGQGQNMTGQILMKIRDSLTPKN